jgi:ABC-type glycerol-3-phosphate transport system permease component
MTNRAARVVRHLGRAGIYAGAVLVVAFILLPFAWILITSLQKIDYLQSVPPRVSLRDLDTSAYAQLFRDQNFRRALGNSIVAVGASSLLAMAIATLGGFAVGTYSLRGKSLLLFFLLIVQLVPALALLIPFFMVLTSLGLVDTFAGLILVFLVFQVPVGIWMLRGFFAAIPAELYDAAEIDGCTRWGTLLRVSVPLARPGIVAVGIYTFIGGWNDLLIPLIASLHKRTLLTVYTTSFGNQYGNNYGGAAAVAVLSALPTIVMAIVFRRQLIQGLTAGAVKG